MMSRAIPMKNVKKWWGTVMFIDQPAADRELAIMTRLNAATIKQLAALKDDYDQPVRLISFSPDNRTLAASTLDSITLWDIERAKRLVHSRMPALNLLYSPDGSTLVITGRDILFIDPLTGKTRLNMKGHRSGTTGIAFSPDGTLFASGGMDGMALIGNLRTRSLVVSFEHQSQVRGLALSPDGETLATIAWGDVQSPRGLYLWHVRTGRRINELKCHTEKNLAFSPDGRLLAMDGQIFEVPSLRQVHDLRERMIAFSPDSRLAASCRSDFNSVGIWDMATGEQITLLKGHAEGIWSVAFSPDGKWLASSSGRIDTRAILSGEAADSLDNSVRLWGVEVEDTRPLRRTTGRLQPLPSKKTTRSLR
jgi:WD40 repeat protein